MDRNPCRLLFYGEIMGNAIEAKIKNYNKLINDLDKMKEKSEKAVNRTLGEFVKRAPAWISKEVVKEYNIKKSEISVSKKSSGKAVGVKAVGTTVDTVALIYRGTVLTPTHFGMTPKARPAKGTYSVKARMKKEGSAKALSSIAFLGNAGAGTTQIPFQRRSSSRYPIDAIKTVSVPQMISNTGVSEEIRKAINENMEKRIQHNLKQLMK